MLHLAFMTPFLAQPPKVDAADYTAACCKNKVIEDCYFSFVFAFDSVSVKDKMLSDNVTIQLYFTIRVHHKCEIILDSVRAKSKASGKERALRAKLAK